MFTPCKYITYKYPYGLNISIPLSISDSEIDENLAWKCHTEKLEKKVNSATFVLRRLVRGSNSFKVL